MEDLFLRAVDNLCNRLDGPLHFRFILQPLIAICFAVIDGMKDANLGRPAYFWALISDPKHRKYLLKDCWKSVGKIFILAIILDVIYQLKAHPRIYPSEILIVAFILAIVPYVLLRGPVNLLMRLCKTKKT